MGLGALIVTVSESQRARHCSHFSRQPAVIRADDVRSRAGFSRESVRGIREEKKAE